MKKVIFLCLLSFTMCLSSANDNPGTPAQQVSNVPKTENKAQVPPSAGQTTPGQNEPKNTDKTTVIEQKVTTQTATLNNTNADNKTGTAIPTDTKANKTGTTTSNDTKVDNKTGTVTPNNIQPDDKQKPGEIVNKNDTKVTPIAHPNKTDTDDKKGSKNDTTTQNTTNSTKTNEAPKADANTPVVPAQARGFDGGSFIGGIILTLGLLAIGFIGYKYYRNRAERNYRTL